MPRTPIILFCLLCLLVFAGACFNGRITISVLEPATVTLPAAIQRISILSVPGVIAKSNVFDSISHVSLPENANVRSIKMGYLHGIVDVMSASPRFQQVVLADSALSEAALNGKLHWDDAVKICKHDTTNVLLVLSKAVSYDALRIFGLSQELELNDISYKIRNITSWVFFLPDQQQQLARFLLTDTIVFQGVNTFTDFEDILYQACYSSGRRSGNQLSPHWINVPRFYYTGAGKDMRTASSHIINNQWVDAALIWNRLAESPNSKLASRAAYNLALAYERDDMLDQSYLWITYSDSLYGSPRTAAYMRILNNRLQTKVKLDEQMTGN